MATAPTRQVAVKTTIGEIIAGTYVQEKEQNPNYLLTTDNQKIYRLNLYAIVVSKEQLGTITNFWIDDGTGKMVVRCFEEYSPWLKLNVGEAILIIGRVRVYNQERYISPEIIKKIAPLWLKARALELSLKLPLISPKKSLLPLEISEETIEEIFPENAFLPTQKLIQLIKELDQGQGALIEEVIEKSSLENTEKIIEKMIRQGEIFQNLPGRVKAL